MIEIIQELGALKPKETSKYKVKYALYRCLCGNEFKVICSHIKSGHTTSCGCIQKKKTSEFNSNTKKLYPNDSRKLYSVWSSIKIRTLKESYKEFHNYGGRGITICDEWRNDFMSFYNWSKANGYEEGLTIDRINNDGNYEPSNCRWVTQKVNSNNRRCSKNKKETK